MLCFLAALLMVLGVPVAAFAAPGYIDASGTIYFQRYNSNEGWTDYRQREYHLNNASGPILFCIEGGKTFPSGDLTEKHGLAALKQALKSAGAESRLKSGITLDKYIEGLLALMSWGYPHYIPEGMTADQARYATAAAFHSYTALSVKSPSTQGFGYSYHAEYAPTTHMRAKSSVAGSGKVYEWYTTLYKKGLALEAMPQDAALSPATLELSDDGEFFRGEISVELTNMNRGYVIDEESLEQIALAGGTVEGFTGNGGDVLTVSIPREGNRNSSFSLGITAKDTRNYADIGLVYSTSEPDRWQKLIGLIGGSGLMEKKVQAELTAGNYAMPVSLQKVSSDESISASGLYSMEGAEFELSGVDLSGQPLSEVVILDSFGRASGEMEYAVGTEVTVREIKAPRGFLPAEDVVFTVKESASANVVTITDDPVAATAGRLLKKVDSASGGAAQGNASLEGAVYSFRYWPALYASAAEAEASGQPARTWLLRTDQDGCISMDQDHKAGGDDLFVQGGKAVLPLGTVVVLETAAPAGYKTDPRAQLIRIELSEDGASAVITGDFAAGQDYLVSEEEVKLFGIRGKKLDAARAGAGASGDATLGGAKIAVYNRSDSAVTVGGISFSPGQKVAEMTTSASGSYSLSAKLPFGRYELKETSAPEGYQLSDWSYVLKPAADLADGTVIEVPAASALADEAIPQTLVIRKWDAGRGVGNTGAVSPKEALEGIRFEIVNSSAAAVVFGGKTVEPGAAVTTVSTAFDQASGEYRAVVEGLPYGTYSVRELSGEGLPEGLANQWYLVDDPSAVTAVLHKSGSAAQRLTELDFTDTRLCSLTITKTVSGSMGNKDKAFDFELELSPGGKHSFTLKHGESISFDNIPQGTSYVLKETGAERDGYTVSCSGDLGGTVSSDLVLHVENRRDAVVMTGLGSGGIAPAAAVGAGSVIAAAGGTAVVFRRKRQRDAAES